MHRPPTSPERKITPRKHLGQHFLVNQRVCERIVDACGFRPDDVVLEIGPGQGALSTLIAERVAQFYAVEKDRRLYESLNERLRGRHIHLIHDDFLAFDLKRLPVMSKIVGNLPYNISGPIIIKLLEDPRCPRQMFFTVQDEFARRLTGRPHTKDYGALTCFVQYHCNASVLFKVRNTAFFPVPKVTSAVVQLTRRAPRIEADNPALLFTLIRQAFQQRRKMILNALNVLMSKAELSRILTALGLDKVLRPENLTLADYIHISNEMNNLKNEEK